VEVKRYSSTMATFVYDADGQRVKATVGGVTTGYVGNYYEIGSSIRKYYYLGGLRVAMRDGRTLSFLLGDHLGSQAITADGNGGRTGERIVIHLHVSYPYATIPPTLRAGGLQTQERQCICNT
jgi:hypothetical protein